MANSQKNNGIEKIISTIKHLSQTTEYKVRALFEKMGYVSEPLYYSDHDPRKNINVIRELDFLSIKNTHGKYQIKGFFRKKTKGSFHNFSFLGDVKYYRNGELRIVGFLDPSLGEMESKGSFGFQVMKLIKPELFSDLISGSKSIELSELNYPTCHQIILFNQYGDLIEKENNNRNKKKINIRSMCEQITSGFINKKQEEFHSILIPLLVFGSKIKFIVGFPNQIADNNYSTPKGICYRFASSVPSDHLTIPIIITSIDNLESVIRSIESYFETFFRFKLINTGFLPHTINVH